MLWIILLINGLMGATFSIVKLILERYTDPFFLVGYRMTLAGSLLLGYVWYRQRASFKMSYADLGLFAQVVLFHVYITYLFEFCSQKYLDPAKVALLFNLTPFITAGLSYVMYRQKQSWKKMLGLVIGFVGFLPILLENAPTEGSWQIISLPEITLFIAVLSAAYAWLVVEKLVIQKQYSALMVNGVGMLGGGLMALITSWVAGHYRTALNLSDMVRSWDPWPFEHFGALTLWVLLLILFSNLIYYNVYAWLMHRYSPTFLSFAGLTVPLFAAGWEWLIFGTVVTGPFWASLLIVSGGLAIYYYEEMQVE